MLSTPKFLSFKLFINFNNMISSVGPNNIPCFTSILQYNLEVFLVLPVPYSFTSFFSDFIKLLIEFITNILRFGRNIAVTS